MSEGKNTKCIRKGDGYGYVQLETVKVRLEWRRTPGHQNKHVRVFMVAEGLRGYDMKFVTYNDLLRLICTVVFPFFQENNGILKNEPIPASSLYPSQT